MIHPKSEADFDFDFDVEERKIRLRNTDSKLTSFAGLAAFASFLIKMGIIDLLVKTCPIKRTSPNATPVRDIIIGFMLSSLTGANRFRDIISLQNDQVLGELFGVERRIPGDDTVRRFFAEFKETELREWISGAYEWLMRELNIPYILDWDSTITTRYGSQEGVEVGYNPNKPGRPSHHPLIASIAGSRFCLPLFQRPGNVNSAHGWIEAMEYLLSKLPQGNRPYINRGDIGFGTDRIMRWHEEASDRPNYLFKLKKSPRVKELIKQISDAQWNGAESVCAMQVIDTELQLQGWNKKRRVVIGRKLISEQSPEESGTLFGVCHYDYHVYVTNLLPSQLEFWQVVELYNQRADCENIFDELKNQWGLSGFCSQKGQVTELAGQFNLLTYNLWNLFTRFFSGKKHHEGKRSRRDYMNIPAKWTKSARQTVLQMSIPERLLEPLRAGYALLIKWLNQTAPQLKLISLTERVIPEKLCDAWMKMNQKLILNCGI